MTKKLLLSLLILSIFGQLKAQIPSYVPTSGLVGWWPFNGNANDESGNGNNGTVNGATLTTDRNGNTNSAYDFTVNANASWGSQQQRIVIPNPNIPSVNAFTMSGWVYMTPKPSPYNDRPQTIMARWDGNGTGVFRFQVNNNTTYYQGETFLPGDLPYIVSCPVINFNEWHHTTISYDGNVFCQYIDGVLYNSYTINSQIPYSTSDLTFGEIHMSNGHWLFFNGKLDDLGYWNRALTQSEITGLYTSTAPSTPPTLSIAASNATICAGTSTTLTATASSSNTCSNLTGSLATGLVGYWPFCGNANDESGNGNNGTVNGATLTTDRFGNVNSAYSFGVNQTINAGAMSNLGNNPTNYTQSIWIKMPALPSGSNNYFPLLSKRHDNSGTDWMGLRVESDGKLKIFADDALYTGAIIGESGVLNTNEWIHVVGIKNGNIYTLYVNGVQVASITDSHAMSGSSMNMIFGAQLAWSKYFEGQLDDIAIWNRALTAAEIQELYTAGQTTYSWSPGGATTPSITVSPTTTTTYTCTVTDANNQTATESSTVTVVNTSISASATTICEGDNVTLTASTTGSASSTACPTLSGTLTTGLVGYWPFCGNANDESGNGNNGTVNGAILTTDRFGNANSAYFFNGSSSSVAINNNFYNNGWNENSICLWFKPNGNSINSCLLNTIPHDGTAISFGNYGTNQKLYFGKNADPTQHLWNIIGGALGNNEFIYPIFNYTEWYFISIVKYGNTYSFYVNGVLDHTTTSTITPISYYCAIILGNLSPNQGYASEFYHGALDDVAVWNRALTAAEIQELYTAGQTTYSWSTGATTPTISVSPTTTTTYTCTVTDANGNSCSEDVTITVVPVPTITASLDSVCVGQSSTLSASISNAGGSACPAMSGSLSNGLIGYWPFCGNANDATANGNNGQVNGATLGTDRFGNANSAYNFNNNSITVPYNSNLNTPQLSVSVWVKPTSWNTTSFSTLVGRTDELAASGKNYRIWVQGGDFKCEIFDNTGASIWMFFSGVPLNDWTMLTFTWDGTTLVVYTNGLANGPLIMPNFVLNSNSQSPIHIGKEFQTSSSTSCCEHFGLIDDVAMWNRALTAAEIQQLYQAGQNTYTYDWNPGATTGNSISVTPTATTTYTCSITSNGTTCSADQLITVIPFTGVDAGTDVTICQGGNVTLSGSGATTYSWDNGVQDGVAFTPVASGVYVVTGNMNGCTDTDTLSVTVLADPELSTLQDAAYCVQNGSANPLTVSVSGGLSTGNVYQWYANTLASNTNGTPIVGATSASYTPPNNNTGTSYYYCLVNQGNSNSGCETLSNVATITVGSQASISTQPITLQEGCVGATLTPLSVAVVNGVGTPSYQWYENTSASNSNGILIGGATSPNYLPPVQSASNLYYYCEVSYPSSNNTCASVNSNTANVVLINDPIFAQAPAANQSVCVGGAVGALTFTMTGGSGTNTYQWYAVNGSTYTTILGANSTSYTPPTFTLAGTYGYAVAVTQSMNGCATGYSSTANINVVADPVVSTPTGAAYCASATNASALSVVATGGINNAYTYQWHVNGTNSNVGGIAISNATNSTYTPPTTFAGTSYYYCTVSQGLGCASTSATAAVQIVNGPAFSSQPLASQTVCQGSSISALSFNYIGGYGLPTYQWFANTANSNFNGTPIAGANTPVYNPNPNATGTNYYYCVVSFSNLYGCNALTTNPSAVSIIANPTFSTSPLASQTLCLGTSPQTLSATTSGGYGTATYQWYTVANGNYTPIIGANSLNYAPSANNPVGTYNYAVSMSQTSSGCYTGFSSIATVNVVAQPTVSAPLGGVYCQSNNGANPLTVNVSGGNGTSNYQWYQNTTNSNTGGTPIAQANSNTYTPSISSPSAMYYYCVVNQSTGCAASSAVATIVVNPAPVLTSQPTALQTICSGATAAVLNVSYSGGAGTPQYQWFSNTNNSSAGGTPITGANSSSYTPNASTNLGSNYYYCVVSSSNTSCPSVISNAATVAIVANPTVNGPSSAAYCQSTSAAQPLSVVATGGASTNYNYQWYSNTTNSNSNGFAIAGANTASYTPLLGSNTSYYYCVITQSGGCQSNSSVASIDILSSPSITQQVLAGQTVCLGGSAQVLEIVSTGGVGAPSYQWYSNTTPSLVGASAITGATAASYTPTAPGSASSTYYYCQVSFVPSTNCPTLTSNFSTLSVIPDPILSSPLSATYCQNSPSVQALNCNATGGINSSYTYQWYSNTSNSNIGGTAIPGANSASYLPSAAVLGSTYYYCEVTQGSGCNAVSTVAEITIGVAASLSQQPQAVQHVCFGQSTQLLSVGVNAGNSSVTYQWFSNNSNSTVGGVLIVGATSASYLPPNNNLGTKYYYCVVTVANGGCGVLTTTAAEVNVVTAPSMFGPPNQSICCQATTAPIAFTGTANNYSWTATASSPLLTGYNNVGTGDLPPMTLTNNSTTPQNVVFMVTPSNAGCSGTPVQFSINVMPCLSVNTPTDQYYCAGESVGAYVFTGVGTSFAWVTNNPSIGTPNAGINFVPNFTAVNTSTTTQVATITVTPQFQGCAGAAQSFNITVYPLPVVDAGADQAVCAGTAVTLSGTGATTYAWNNGVIDNQSFIPNSAATYTVIGTDQNGCQQTDQLTVVVNQPTTSTLNITACDSYQLNGQTYTQSGTYTQQTSNINGCDSTITLNLTMNYSPNTPAIYVQNQVNLSTDLVAGLTYQWISCTDLTAIAGQTAITFNPTVNNVYAVVVTNSCGSDTSMCMSITTIGLDENQQVGQILVYPNPNNGNFNIEIPEYLLGKQMIVYDMRGRMIYKELCTLQKQWIELPNLARGAYWLEFDQQNRTRIVID